MMWSAMNWLSQKAGINLDDAHEVLHGSDASFTQQADSDDENSESSKENQTLAGNAVATANGKRFRRSSRWVPATSLSPAGSNSPAHLSNNNSLLYHGGVSPSHGPGCSPLHPPLPGSPLTPIMVPSGISSSPYCNSVTPTGAHPSMPPIMVPTGVRTPVNVGFRVGNVPGLIGPGLGNTGSSSKLSTTSSQWKEASMAADINSPGFAFRIARQAEKHADLGSKLYPTAQEKYLVAKHLPRVRLRSPSKPVMTPKKPQSVPLIQLPSSPKPPSALAPLLSTSPHMTPSASSLFSPSSQPMPDFRHTDFFTTSIRSSADSHPVLSGLLDGTGSPIDHHSNSRSLDPSDLTTLGNGGPFGESFCDDDCTQDDPTSLKAVLAALNKSKPGKGIKRARILDCEDSDSKRQCSDDTPLLPEPFPHGSLTSHNNFAGGGGEKRALDTSSSSSLDNSGHGSPCAKVARTSPDILDGPLLSKAVSSDFAASSTSNNITPSPPRASLQRVAPSVGLGGGSHLLERDSEDDGAPAKKRKVNPWLASFSSSRKMVEREENSSDTRLDCENLDTDGEGSDKSSDDSDNSMSQEEDEDEAPAPHQGSPAPTSHQQAPKEHGDVVLEETTSAATPHIVTLSAHRSDKRMQHTRLNKMLGMLFHLPDDEVASSTAKTNMDISRSNSVSAAGFVVASTSAATYQSSSLGLSMPSTAVESCSETATTETSVVGLQACTTSSSTSNVTGITAITAPSSEATSTAALASVELVRQATISAANVSESTSSPATTFSFKVPTSTISSEDASIDPKPSHVVDGSKPLLSFLANNAASCPEKQTPTSSSVGNVAPSSIATTTAPSMFFGSGKETVSSRPLTTFSSSSSIEPSNQGNLSTPMSNAFAPPNISVNTIASTASSAVSAPSLAFGNSTSSGNTGMFTFGKAPPPAYTASDSSPVNQPVSASGLKLPSFGSPAVSVVPSTTTTNTTISAIGVQDNSSEKSSGFQFGFGAASGGFGNLKPQEPAAAASAGGFSFGSSATFSQAKDPIVSTVGSFFAFGSSSSSNAVVDSPANVAVSADSASKNATSGTNPPMLSFGNNLTTNVSSSNSSTSAAKASIPTFNFGSAGTNTVGTSSSVASSGASTVPFTNSSSTSFSFCPTNSSSINEKSESNSTSASFTFIVKNDSKSVEASKASVVSSASPFTFGSAATVAPTVTPNNSSSTSLFSFGNVGSTTEAKANTNSAGGLFAFGASNASSTAAPVFGGSAVTATDGFGSGVPATTASTAPQFGLTTSSTLSFGSSSIATSTSSSDKPLTGFGGFGNAGNLFAGIKNGGSNSTFDLGVASNNATSVTSKAVTFGGASLVTGGSGNLFGQTVSDNGNNSSNLFGQAASVGSSGLFGKIASNNSTPAFGSSTFGQSSKENTDKPASTSSSSSPFQFGSSSTNANTAGAAFTFGSGSASGKSDTTFGSFSSSAASPFGGASTGTGPTFGASASNSASTFGSGTSNLPPSFGSTTSNTAPSFGSAPGIPVPSFSSGTALSIPSFGSASSAVPSFGSPSLGAPSFGSPSPSFGSPAPGQPGMFQFNSGSTTPQPHNAFNASGGSSSNASRRPRARAHRRNR
ncbi:nuclear pore complex protein DDB_G0274915 isoform X2 [Hyalella azteca]|uniref:Nuclear pore complex protein DDB_G0274915 isoform X2 n=1 Tax=Hyalella azteca TaxID=294128 RepID=A0A8B7NSK1_HYAAZ|nr:nuclear pore complex protein DDB_G0274915 isoform X2 [Hyalella azteca]